MATVLEQRRLETNRRVADLRSSLAKADEICTGKACTYMTGSFARGEAHIHSDLDLFILGQETSQGGIITRSLAKLDEIRLKASLIEATRLHSIPDFSGDGEFLVHYSVAQLKKHLGTPGDDATNTFTARLLLLLESRPLVGDEQLYTTAVSDIVAVYWRDYADHSSEFVPAFLANDILRFWRTLCVNYEARTQTEPEEKKAKRKLKNYKLKYSRLLTCYSALLYLLRVHVQDRTVTPERACEMVRLMPTQRLEWLMNDHPDVSDDVAHLLTLYEEFLASTDVPEQELVSRFMDKQESAQRFRAAKEFGDAVAELLDRVGAGSALRRLLFV